MAFETKARSDGLRRYGEWAGNPKGYAEDVTRCIVEVGRPLGRTTMFGQCDRKRGHGPDGLYCKQHDPAVVAKREAEKRERWAAENERRMRPHRRTEALIKALREIAEGHNDPRALSKAVLDEWSN